MNNEAHSKGLGMKGLKIGSAVKVYGRDGIIKGFSTVGERKEPIALVRLTGPHTFESDVIDIYEWEIGHTYGLVHKD